jgi:hypothetical protein
VVLLLGRIQTIIENYLEAKKLTESVVGTIEKISPLTVKIDSKPPIDEDFIHIPSNMKLDKDDIGKKVLLLRVQSGQLFIILDKY